MISIAKPLLIALAVLLAVSLLANAGLTWTYLDTRDDLVEAKGARDQARGAATACSEGVKALEDQASDRHREAERNNEKAREAQQSHEAHAQQILAAPAAVPGDDCKSASAAVDAWLQGRAQP